MNKFTGNCELRAEGLIKKSFPSLKNKYIKVLEIPMRKYYSGGVLYPLPIIFINKSFKDSSLSRIKGVLVHELCHLEIFFNRGFFKNTIKGILYHISSKHRRIEEREAEELAIEKGYAHEIYTAALESNKLKTKKISSYYMSIDEIKRYAKSIGKW